MNKSVSETIRERREVKGLTQAALANSLGIASPRVSDWETGKYKPSAKSAAKLAKVLGGTILDYLDI